MLTLRACTKEGEKRSALQPWWPQQQRWWLAAAFTDTTANFRRKTSLLHPEHEREL